MPRENDYYSKLTSSLKSGKDSIFEPCRIMEYNPETLTATVRSLHSMQRRENVTVLFPSLFLNAGFINPPAPNSTGILFWGADRQAFLFPAQYMKIGLKVDDGVVQPNNSPKEIDPVFDLSYVEGGEQLMRSLHGSEVYVKNNGDISMTTYSGPVYELLEEEDESFLVAGKESKHIGTYESYIGNYINQSLLSDKSNEEKQHAKIKGAYHIVDLDNLLSMENDKMVEMGESDAKKLLDSVNLNTSKDFELQYINVFDEEDNLKLFSEEHPVELFMDLQLLNESNDYDNQASVTLSKTGDLNLSIFNPVSQTSSSFSFEEKRVAFDYNGYSFLLSDEGAAIKKGNNTVSVTDEGIMISTANHSNSFDEIIEAINRLNALNDLSDI